MKKRIFGILLTLCMVFSLLPAAVLAADPAVVYSGTCGENATFVITDDGVMTISGTGTVTEPISNDEYQELKETISTGILSVVIGEGITAIDNSAFEGDPFYYVESLYLPDSLLTIGDSAFAGTPHLKDVHFGNHLKTIGASAFARCPMNETLEIPRSVTSIGYAAFRQAESETIIIPGSIKDIPNSAFTFSRCKNVVIEDGVESIGAGAFEGCSNLENIEIPNSVQSLSKRTFANCFSLTSIVIPGSVKTIPENVVIECRSLKTIILEDGVEILEPHAFSVCDSLTEIYLPDTITKIGAFAFSSCIKLKEIRIPVKIQEIKQSTFANCIRLKTIILSNNITTIDSSAFYETSLESIYYAGTEDQFMAIDISSNGMRYLENATVYLLPAMPDPVFGMFDLPKRTNWAYPGIAFCLSTGLMNGTGNGYFEPNATTTRGQLVTILWRMLDEPAPTQAAPFTDLKQKYYRNAIAWAAENNIVKGVSDTRFDPDAPITREQLVTIFYRLCKDYLGYDMSPAVALDSFPDGASVSKFARNAMQWAVAVKLIKGSTEHGVTYLKPKDTATRAQIATVMLNFYNTFAEDAE